MALKFWIGLAPFEPEAPPVLVDAIYVESDGSLQATPIRSYELAARGKELLVHTRLAFAVRRGERSSLRVTLRHEEPKSGDALEIRSVCLVDEGAVEMDRYVVHPGAETEITMSNVDALEIREIPWRVPSADA